MIQPTDVQKQSLIDSLDVMDRSQWTAMVRWMLERLVADDQAMAATILWREAARRQESANKFQSDEKRKKTAEECLIEVLRDVGAKLVVA